MTFASADKVHRKSGERHEWPLTLPSPC
jgi:hypothetical protein